LARFVLGDSFIGDRGRVADVGKGQEPIGARARTSGLSVPEPRASASGSGQRLWILDRDLVVRALDRWAAAFQGLPVEASVGRCALDWLPDGVRRAVRRAARSFEQQGSAADPRFVCSQDDGAGTAREVEWSLSPLFGDGGALQGFALAARDLPDPRGTDPGIAQRAETCVLRALASVGESAALLAHEIKNPITAVNVALRAVADELDEDHRAVLEELVGGMRRLEQMLRRTLSFARPLELKCAPIEAGEFLTGCVADLQPLIAARAARVEVRTPPAPTRLSADPQLLEEVVANLVTNALEAHGGEAHVVLSLAQLGRELVLAVDDDGPGIPEAVRDTLFRPFVTTKPDGNGFGLALCRRVVEEHGGSISAGPSPLGGARFEIRLRGAS
jgi:signal transduction histidine kinase